MNLIKKLNVLVGLISFVLVTIALSSCNFTEEKNETEFLKEQLKTISAREQSAFLNKEVALKLLSKDKWYYYSRVCVSSEPDFSGTIVYLAPGDTLYALDKYGWLETFNKNDVLKFRLPTDEEEIYVKQYRTAKDLVCEFIKDAKPVVNKKETALLKEVSQIADKKNRDLALRLISKDRWYILNEYTVTTRPNGEGESITFSKNLCPLAKYGFLISPIEKNMPVKFSIITEEEKELFQQFKKYMLVGGFVICKKLSEDKEKDQLLEMNERSYRRSMKLK